MANSDQILGVLDESNLADLVAESVVGPEGQQYEDLDADILRTGGVNAAGNQLQPSAQTDSFDDVDLDACVNAELLQCLCNCRSRSGMM